MELNEFEKAQIAYDETCLKKRINQKVIDDFYKIIKSNIEEINKIYKIEKENNNSFESIEEVENTIAMNLIAFSKRPDLFNAEFDSDTNSFEILNRKKEKFIIRVEKDVDVYGVEAIRCYVLTSYDNSVSKNAKKITDSEEKEYRREQINRTKY